MPAASSFYLGKQAVQQHVDQALAEIIQPDEWLLAAFHGQALSGEGYGASAKTKGGFSLHDYLLVTDQRVIFWARGLFKRSTDGFHYEDIASVEEATGMMLGEIVLNVRGAKERMRSMVKTDAPVAARMIRERVTQAKGLKQPPVASPVSPQAVYLLSGDGQQEGPFSAAQLQQKLAAGDVAADRLAWHEGLPGWQPLSQVASLLRPPSSPPPAPLSPPPPPVPAPSTSSALPTPTTALPAPAPALPSWRPVTLDPTPSGPIPPRERWYKRKGWQIAFFLFFPFFQVPLMWYWGLFTKQTRIGVTVAGVFWCLCLLAGQGDQQRDETVAQPTRTVAPTPMITATPEAQVSWNEIDSIYSLNSRNTDLQKKEEWKRFKGKKVTWNGTVASVNDGLLGTTLQVKMNADTFTSDALVSLKRSEHAKAARLHEGDRVTFSGRLVDWGTLLPVSLDQGEIIE